MYYKYIKDDCILGIGTGAGKGVVVTEEEYNKIQEVIDNKPTTHEGHYCVLNKELEWEQKKVENANKFNEEDL